MSTVIRLSELELNRLDEIRLLFKEDSELRKEFFALNGQEYIEYTDIDDIHDLIGLCIHYSAVHLQCSIRNQKAINQSISRKKES